MSVIATDTTAGYVYMVNYDELGPEYNEMVKCRMAVVVSPRRLNVRRNLVTVVPLSEKAPTERERHVVPLTGAYKWIREDRQLWAKCDIIHSLGPHRLGLLWDDNEGEKVEAYQAPRKRRAAKGIGHNRRPPNPRLSAEDLKNVRTGLVEGIDFAKYLEEEERQRFRKSQNQWFRKLLPWVKGPWS